MSGRFHPVIALPPGTPVLDMAAGPMDLSRAGSRYAIGRYNERRPGIYLTPLFGGARDIHVGVDLFGPVGTPVHAFDDGSVHLFGYNGADGDYGYTLVTRHRFEDRELYALHGHLSLASVEGRSPGQPIRRGEVIGWLGDRAENGNWPPHVHFQLSWEDPGMADMPGVVSAEGLEDALRRYPDPRIVLGPIY